MTASGWILAILGLLAMLVGFGMGTSAPGATVVNLSLMQQQTVTLTLSGFLFLSGCILIAGGSIVRAIQDRAGPNVVVGDRTRDSRDNHRASPPVAAPSPSAVLADGKWCCPKCGDPLGGSVRCVNCGTTVRG